MTDRIVEIAAITDEAVPAIWPIGCSASALRLPNVSPAMKKIETDQMNQSGNASAGGDQAELVQATRKAAAKIVCTR